MIGRCFPRHRATKFRTFLDEIEANVPSDLDVRLVMDNDATHNASLVRNWLAKRPRWHIRRTPTSASRMNQVERLFGLLTEKQIRRGVHQSVDSLRHAIQKLVDHHNREPKPFKWTELADDILGSIERFYTRNTQQV